MGGGCFLLGGGPIHRVFVGMGWGWGIFGVAWGIGAQGWGGYPMCARGGIRLMANPAEAAKMAVLLAAILWWVFA